MSAITHTVAEHAARRRTVAVISHPDAGKSTLTEALLLHARAITEAGAVHGKRGRQGTVSDWMSMEKERGISISSAAIQFAYGDTIINLVDTPGHSDFSEDTYRVLSAVDAAIMLVDAAKGLETQTMKLFEVCRRRGIPIITMINKWDRPGRAALDLMDEIRDRTGMLPTPLTWPVGDPGHFEGLLDVPSGRMLRFTRSDGGARVAEWQTLEPAEAEQSSGAAWVSARDEAELLGLDGYRHDPETFQLGITTPVIFGAAVHNIGVHSLLEILADEAPAAMPRVDVDGEARPVDADFSAYVFKVQSGLDTAHRDRIAFIRVCSGRFERGMTVTHARTGRPFATKYAHQLFGQDREVVDEAFPGDIVGLVNATMLRPGDTLHSGPGVRFPALPVFTPEHFRLVRAVDVSKHKQFRSGLESLDQEGVVQVLRSTRRGDQSPVLGAVGPLQFEVFADRMQHDFNAPVRFEPLPYEAVMRTDEASAEALDRQRECEVVRRADGVLLALLSTPWRAKMIARTDPDLTLEPLDDGAAALV